MEFLLTWQAGGLLESLGDVEFVPDETDATIGADFERGHATMSEEAVNSVEKRHGLAEGHDRRWTIFRQRKRGGGKRGRVAPQNLREALDLNSDTVGRAMSRWVAIFAGPAVAGLRLFCQEHDRQLRPLEIPARPLERHDALVVELQCVPERFYFAIEFNGDHLGASLLPITRSPSLPFPGGDEALRMEDFLLPTGPVEAFVEESFCEAPCFPPQAAATLLTTLEGLVRADRVATAGSPGGRWCRVAGPMDYRNFEYLELSKEAPLMAEGVSLLRMLTSDAFRELVSKMSGLDLVGLCLLDGRRITQGAYQMFNDRYSEPPGLDVVITLLRDPADGGVQLAQDGGSWLYLVEGEQVACIRPRHNTISLAYRVEGCTRFMPLLCDVPSLETFEVFQLHLTFVVKE